MEVKNVLGIEDEISSDLRKYLMEDTLFLNEDINNPEQLDGSVSVTGSTNADVKEVSMDKKKFDFSKKEIVVSNKAKNLIQKMKSDNEEDLLKAPSRMDLLIKCSCKFAACSILLGGPITGLIGYFTQKFITKGMKTKKRRELLVTYQGDLTVINQKLEELNDLKKLSNNQKNQRYELLKMKRQLEYNIEKLKDLIQYNNEA